GASSLAPQRLAPFPYTTLFRSARPRRGLGGDLGARAAGEDLARRRAPRGRESRGRRARRRRPAAGEFLESRPLVGGALAGRSSRSEEHTSELQSRVELVCRLLL